MNATRKRRNKALRADLHEAVRRDGSVRGIRVIRDFLKPLTFKSIDELYLSGLRKRTK